MTPDQSAVAMPVLLLCLYCPLYPVGEVGHLGVDAVLALPAAPLPEGGDTVDCPPVILLTQQRTT